MNTSILALLIAASLTATVTAATYDVIEGTIDAPDDFVFKRTGTIDSFMGTLTRKTDGFTIKFDIGAMSGMYVFVRDGEEDSKWSYLRQHVIAGRPAWTAIETTPQGRQISSTVGDVRKRQEPANFTAAIQKDSDIADFLLIVGTYKAK